MRFIRVFLFVLFFAPVVSHAATNEFSVAAQLLAAAKNADIQQVQALINNGANVNFVDSTGLSIVCTALMNNDIRAAQILQMYGADASQCDRQIKKYNSRNKPKGSGGLFSGLSSAQSITLTAAGAAVIVGGLYVLTDWLNPGNDNDSTSSGGSHGGGSGGSGSTDSGNEAFTLLPSGPLSLTENYNYNTELDFYSTQNTSAPIIYNNYQMMTDVYKQNYLLMMHGYSPFARGYLGMTTLRNSSTNAPLNIAGNNIGGDAVLGGMPVNVAIVTANGINADEESSLADRLLPWTTVNLDGSGTGGASNANISSKYYNNKIIRGGDNDTLSDDSTEEDDTLIAKFDLSGNGTAINNTGATAEDNLIAKVIGGNISGSTAADFVGFMPNGQMSVFRTGGGVDNSGNPIDYYNYRALYLAATELPASTTAGRSAPFVIANTNVLTELRDKNVETIDYISSFADPSSSSNTHDLRQAVFATLVDKYYDRNTTDGTAGANAAPSSDATSLLAGLGSLFSPITVFSTGSNEISATEYQYRGGTTYTATFENAAPLIFNNNEHLFMSVVGVVLDGDGTNGQESVSGYAPSGTYRITQWQNTNGTPGDTTDDTYYRARTCGYTGTGTDSVDPWCFAAAGVTDELATASAAGAVGVLKSAFPYLSSKQIYTLMALTADGAYLGTNDSGVAFTDATLTSYLQSKYTLPADYQSRVGNNGNTYLDVFKEVFGYGLINLERATTPGKTIYYFGGSASNPDIVSGSGNAYWRAASNTAFSTSSVLPMRVATITTSAYDVLESIDGSMSLPRIWESSFAIGNSSRHGLYMGDVLGELKTRRDNTESVKFGNLSFHMARSEKAYNDNMGGLDELRLAFDNGAFHMVADYQHYLTDGASRFSGMANPVLALASNAITTGFGYDLGKWTFGARAFSGAITNEGLLENDPTLSSQFTPATLGLINGAASSIAWNSDKFGVTTSFGFAHESDTLLGAQTDGLLDLGAGDTMFVDGELRYSPFEKVSLKLRGTYARTDTGANGLFITDVSQIESNAIAFGADVGNFSFAIARPLAAYNGNAKYAYANYAVVENDNGTYGIDVIDSGVRDLRFGSDKRELRFSGEYRHNFGEFTDGALGFMYRINPNNTDEFGNESLFMLKLTHRVGI